MKRQSIKLQGRYGANGVENSFKGGRGFNSGNGILVQIFGDLTYSSSSSGHALHVCASIPLQAVPSCIA